MPMTVLKCTGQRFYKIQIIGICLMFSSWLHWRDVCYSEVTNLSQYNKNTYYDWCYPDYPAKVTFIRFLHWEGALFLIAHTAVFGSYHRVNTSVRSNALVPSSLRANYLPKLFIILLNRTVHGVLKKCFPRKTIQYHSNPSLCPNQ